MRKESAILELFFNEPSKHWHFEEILASAKISRPQASNWLKKFTKENKIKRVKLKGKMPYYTANYACPSYQNSKKIFILEKLNSSGLFNHLASLPKAKNIFLFGSMTRWDWNINSDIDLFIYGENEGFKYGKYRKKLHRQIEVFSCKDKNDLKKFNNSFLKNVIQGNLIKGNTDFLKVEANV